MAMACRSCRRQLAQLSRHTSVVPSVAPISKQQAARCLSTRTSSNRPDQSVACSPQVSAQQHRHLSSTAPRQGFKDAVGKMLSRQTEPYRVISATENIYKTCAKQADYKISLEDRKNETIPKTVDGEDLGTGSGIWHEGKSWPSFANSTN